MRNPLEPEPGLLAALPAIAALIALAFSVHLFVRAGRRRNWFEAVWGVAMMMFAVASAALFLGVVDGWSSAEFRVYWLFGAVVVVPWLALGEAYLLARRPRVGHVLLVVVLALTAWASAEVRSAPLDAGVLEGSTFFTGRRVLGETSDSLMLARWYSTGAYVLLIAGIVWSALGMRGRPDLRSRFYGVTLIAVGATIVAAGSAFAAAGNFAGFSATLAGGIAAMYWGFLIATRRPRAG